MNRWYQRGAAALAALAVVAGAACSSSGESASDWNKERVKIGFDKVSNRRAQAVLDRLSAAGIECTARQTESFQVLIPAYTKQDIPFPAGSVSCTGPREENLLVEAFRKDGYPTGADFMDRKRALLCQRALDLGKGALPGGGNGFDGIPYVLAEDRSWVIEPDSFAINTRIAKALGLKPRDACAGMKAK